MLKPENKIFKNLYNNYGWKIEKAIERDDWKDTKTYFKGREWIIRSKNFWLREEEEQVFQQDLNGFDKKSAQDLTIL